MQFRTDAVVLVTSHGMSHESFEDTSIGMQWHILHGWRTMVDRFRPQVGAGHGLLAAHLACQFGIM